MPSPSTGSQPQVSASGSLAALDPGRSKCGLVLTDPRRCAIQLALVEPPEVCMQMLLTWQRQGLLAGVVIGDGTGSAGWQKRLAPLLPVIVVPEHGTTLAARERYWQLEPARGWRRLLPEGLRQPPRDWDDVVAQLLLERWLGHPLSRDQKLARTVKT
jgi:hypothetical protein